MHRILGPFKNTYIVIHKGKRVPHYRWAAFLLPEGTKLGPPTVIEIPRDFLDCRPMSFGADWTLRGAMTSATNSVLEDHFAPLSDEQLSDLRSRKWRRMTAAEKMVFRFSEDEELAGLYAPGQYVVIGGRGTGSI